ncbi:DegT/DnrJ/EryC1/StrS family aminotransferase [Patescibacteria group bacterium]|nr:DegT/DnrJ/EryC1/StrS family aminotransferase [Patescibacteria group bacterium]
MKNISLGTIYISTQTKQYVTRVLETKRLSYGPFSQKFENKFAKFHDCQYGLVVSSGTAAIHTILTALKIRHGWQDGDEVLVPAVTFVATVNAVIQTGLKPVLVDVARDSLAINPQLVVNKISKKTRAILPVHPFGKPAAMDALSLIASQHHLQIVEDCCEALGATHQNRKVGSWGVAGAFSTYSAHVIATGIGGVITTNDAKLATLMRSLINHGRSPNYISIDDDDQITHHQLPKMVESRFSFEQIGFSYRLSELEAAVGLSQLNVIAKIIKKRQKNARYLLEKLDDLTEYLELPQLEKHQNFTLLAFPILLTPKALSHPQWQLKNLMLYLESHGIETRQLLPILGQPAYEQLAFSQLSLPIAQYVLKAGCYFGIHQQLTKADLAYVNRMIHNFFQ